MLKRGIGNRERECGLSEVETGSYFVALGIGVLIGLLKLPHCCGSGGREW